MEQEALLLLLLGLLAVAVLVLWGKRSSSKRLPPGPRPLPVFGNLFLFAASKNWHRDFWKLAEKYGPIMWLRIGSQGLLMVQSSELAMDILKTQDSIFCSRPPPSYTVALFTNGGKDVGFAPDGPYWRFIRKLFTMVTSKRIQDFQHMREEEQGRLVEAIKSHIGQPVDLGYSFRILSLNLVTRMGFGKAAVANFQVEGPQVKKANCSRYRSNSGTDLLEDHELPDLVREVVDILGVQGIGWAVPWLGFLDNFLLPKAKFQQTARRINGFYTRVVQEHREYLEAHPGSQPRDFADVLLSLPPNSDGQVLTDDLILPQFHDLIMAGTDTTSSLTEWAMAELLLQPALLEQAVQELDEVVGSSRAVTEADIPNLPYLQAVVKETLRMHPSTPFLLPHYSTQATTVAGYHIPANTTVFVNVWALGRNPAYWSDPDNFQPDRFIHQRPELDFLGHHFELLPFGAGKRFCPGMAMALAAVHLTVAALLHTFTWSLPADVARPQDLDMSELQGITIRKAVSLKAVPSLRLEL